MTTFGEARAEALGRVGLVPTMGYLHEGHLALMGAARSECDLVVMSLFVNPLQFQEEEDLASYPRDLERDLHLAEEVGADLVFAPPMEEMYRDVPLTRVSVETISLTLEGRFRPGHFDGVAIAVAKLLAGIRPDRAYFGRKDAQQLALVRRLVTDLSFPVEIVGVPTVRDRDGLALSSRNVRLAPSEREAALSMFRGLEAAARLVEQGERGAKALEGAVIGAVEAEPAFELEYAELTDGFLVVHLPRLDREGFLAVAGRVGKVRLIDNVYFAEPGLAPDLGTRLERPSILEER